MSCVPCTNSSQCPARMADGRAFTDYRPRCAINFQNISMNSYDYRQYLIANAESIMQERRDTAYEANKCGPCVAPFNQGTMLPEQSMVTCDKSTCSFKVTDPTGLGMGRQYGNGVMSASERAFLATREEEGVCCDPFEPVYTDVGGRTAVPSGKPMTWA